jgi:hypothetical protein
MTIANASDLIPIVVIGSAILAGILWLIKAQVHMSREFRPNGGATLRDSLNRIEKDMREVRGRLDQHIDTHNKGQ